MYSFQSHYYLDWVNGLLLIPTPPLNAVLARQGGVLAWKGAELAILGEMLRARAAVLAGKWKMERGRTMLLSEVTKGLRRGIKTTSLSLNPSICSFHLVDKPNSRSWLLLGLIAKVPAQYYFLP